MLSIAEWTDRALALSSPMKLTSSASFSPSIRISLRLKIHQAQAKNFCRVLDIRVAQIMESNPAQTILFQQLRKARRHRIRLDQVSHCIHKYIPHRRKTINTVDSLLDSVDRKSEGR